MSTETKVAHTAGPWTIVPQSDGSAMVCQEFETGKQMSPKGLRLVTHVLARRDSLKEDEANARLIASAPVLKAERDEALRLLRTFINGPVSSTTIIRAEGLLTRCEARDAAEKKQRS